jgi:Tfp pilus assembly pilus retraction ATPase PilT
MIRDRDFHKLPNAIQVGKRLGMHSLESSLAELYRAGTITQANAYSYANDQVLLDSLLREDRLQPNPERV